ncbi:MAG: hypothetical protein AAF960_14495 [Bacteroidota bacterium]
MSQKNTVNNSHITVGGNVHIGDKFYHFGDQKVPLQMEDKEHIKAHIQQLIAKNKIPKALELLSILAKNEDATISAAVISLTQRWKELKHQEIMGTIRRPDANIERNQMVAKLLELTMSL